MPEEQPQSPDIRRLRPMRALLGPMRIRKKMIVLHTAFSVAMAVILILSIRPAMRQVVDRGEAHACDLALAMYARLGPGEDPALGRDDMLLESGSADALGIDPAEAGAARALPDRPVRARAPEGWTRSILWEPSRAVFLSASADAGAARRSVTRLYLLLVGAILGVYVLIAATLEALVLPRHVYRPIQRLRLADQAVQEGEREHELIPEPDIPSDELGEIMRSRNESIMKLRRNEAALADAVDRIEVVAADLKRKNHLIETVQRNMADQDRLVSLGIMSAGLAHELNTPLAVLKGTVERIAQSPARPVDPAQAQLMLRVVNRLERLSESLLDFARARPPHSRPVRLRAVVEEAWTLVRIDRHADDIAFECSIDEGAVIVGDDDRLLQVFVNILRNAVDAMDASEGSVLVAAQRTRREGRHWLAVTVSDTGPGIDPEVMPRLFEPFTSTRLDSRGTGLGLAVAEGIVREHGGVIVAWNRTDGAGCVFEITLPLDADIPAGDTAGRRTPAGAGRGPA